MSASRSGSHPARRGRPDVDRDQAPHGAPISTSTSATGRRWTSRCQYVPHQSVSALFGAGDGRLRLAGHPAQLIPLTGGTDQGNRLTVLCGDYVVMISGAPSVPIGELKSIAVGMTFSPDGARSRHLVLGSERPRRVGGTSCRA